MSDSGDPQGQLLPAVDWNQLPALDIVGTFVSRHANPIDAMLVELSKRVYQSYLAAMARLLPEPLEVRAMTANMAGYRRLRLFVHLRLAAIDVEHYDREAQTLRVFGKGNKERLAYPDPGRHVVIEQRLEHRRDFDGPLFLRVNKAGAIQYAFGRITNQAIYDIVKKRQKQAGVQACAPHDFRRTFGAELLRQGIDLPTVQRLMGHSDPSTTARYDVRVSEEARRATRGLHLPVGD